MTSGFKKGHNFSATSEVTNLKSRIRKAVSIVQQCSTADQTRFLPFQDTKRMHSETHPASMKLFVTIKLLTELTLT